MQLSIRWRLSLMMLLQYAIWGAWAPVLSAYLSNSPDKGGLGFDNAQLGWIYSLLPLASIVSPFIAGQMADRTFATERFLGVLHLLGGVSLLVMASQKTFAGMVLWMLLFALLYAPTLALTNSLTFHHLSNGEKSPEGKSAGATTAWYILGLIVAILFVWAWQSFPLVTRIIIAVGWLLIFFYLSRIEMEFGGIRVWGTIGWIISGLLLSLFRNQFPSLTPAGMSDSLVLAGVMAILLGLFSFGLPHTPPKKEGVNPWAFLEALKLLRERNFLVVVLISFVVATELQFYYILTAPFLEKSIGIPNKDVPGTMVIAQIAEIVVMAALLPALLPKMGLRRTMVVGILAWPIRYIIFALGARMPELRWLVIASLTLHGFCYVFFFTVGFIYVDRVAHVDIRASAQSLIALVVLGVGSYLGSLFTGWIGSLFTNPDTNVTNWMNVFLVPVVLTVLCAIIFPMLFREKDASSAGVEPATA
jgi:MFS family permease